MNVNTMLYININEYSTLRRRIAWWGIVQSTPAKGSGAFRFLTFCFYFATFKDSFTLKPFPSKCTLNCTIIISHVSFPTAILLSKLFFTVNTKHNNNIPPHVISTVRCLTSNDIFNSYAKPSSIASDFTRNASE